MYPLTESFQNSQHFLDFRDFRQNIVNIDGPKRKVGVRKSSSGKTVGTVDRYRYENADGSITWGYKNEDGSFKVISKF